MIIINLVYDNVLLVFHGPLSLMMVVCCKSEAASTAPMALRAAGAAASPFCWKGALLAQPIASKSAANDNFKQCQKLDINRKYLPGKSEKILYILANSLSELCSIFEGTFRMFQ